MKSWKMRRVQIGFAVGLAMLFTVVLLLGLSAQAAAHPQSVAVGLVTDAGTLNDMGFNWYSYQGLLRAEDALGVAGTVYTSTTSAEYEPNLQQCASDGNDLCIAVGFDMADATWRVAQINPDVDFAIVDVSRDDYPDNLRGMLFAEDQVGYLAGTLAALMTDSDVIGAIGGIPVPAVERFVYGYRNGARCANADVTVLISYTWDFGDPDLGAGYAQGMMAQGADTVFAAAGLTGEGVVLTATQSGAWGIGVDTDYYVTTFMSGTVAGSDRLLSSAMKRLDNAVFDTIGDVVSGTFTSGTVLYDLAADGVALAPFHEAGPFVSQDVRAALAQVRQRIVDGTLDVNDPCWVYSRYVDGVTGNDTPACGTMAAPCQTISYTLNSQALHGDTILIAAGTYTENLIVQKRVTLQGGYAVSNTVSGTVWLPPKPGASVVDGSGRPTMLGDWDGSGVLKPAVISDSGAYKMWYDGANLLNEAQIGLATSIDGISWTKSLSNPVLMGTPGTWHGLYGEHAPFVLKEGGVYKMWYEGTNEHMVRQLGYATSTNGIDWQPYAGNPVLAAGPEGYDQQAAAHGSVLNDGGIYKLWYHALGDQGPVIAYATSTDGVTWNKQGPVLLPQEGNWDGQAVWGPSVLKRDGVYWMWHAGAGPGQQPAIGVVTSTDGISWTHFLTAPVIARTTEIGDPHVISDGGGFKMWYQDFEQGVILYAESDDGITWTPSPSNPVLMHGTPGQWGGPVRFESGSDGSVLDGLTLTGGSDAAGGGVHAGSSDVTIRNCIIRDNFANGVPHSDAGGGVLGGVAGDGQVTLIDTQVISNRVNQGASGVRVHEGSLRMVNTLVADNKGAEGVHLNGQAGLINVTIAGNGVAVGRPGINYNPTAGEHLVMVNTILYGNGDVIHVPDPSLIQVSHSDVQGGWFGTGNIGIDPQFVDPANGNYHLQGNSPAIDAGTPAGAPPADLDGTPRDVPPDMGAYEYTRFDHDVAVVDVLPRGNVAINIPFPIRATLYNVGSSDEDQVPVTCEIVHSGSTLYSETVSSGKIQPLTWQVLPFPSYTPVNQGTYTLTCQSNLVSDRRPVNDTFTRTLVVLEEIADVWTKDNPRDDGDVPSALDSWYESPDLWVRNTKDGGLIHQDPVVGVTNTVYVRLRNRGTVAISGTVDVYWIEPSLGVRCGDWAYIDTMTFTHLLPGEVRIVSTPWVPTRTGHTCLQDVIDSPQDPYNRALECAPQWVPWDNNVEWHNVNVIANPKGGDRRVQDVKQSEVQLVNIYNLPQEVDLIIERMTFPTTGTITVQLPASLFDRWWAYGGHWYEGMQVLTSTREIQVTGAVSATIGAIPMEAAEKAAVGLRFDGPAGLTFEMAIRERIEGLTTGGVAYQWTIPDTTPPTVTDKSPADAASDVALDAPIVITFDEEIAPLNFSLTLTPTLGITATWNDAGTVVTATHAGFTAATTYTATVTASDAAVNVMDPLSWSFVTQAERHWIYLPLTLKEGGL